VNGIILEVLCAVFGKVFVAFSLNEKEHRKGAEKVRIELLKLWKEPFESLKSTYSFLAFYY
jgi:hypothetical protein